MGKLWSNIKTSVKKHRSASTGVTTLLVIILLTATFLNALSSQASAVPSNPIQGLSKDSSLVKLTSTNEVVPTLPKGIAAATTSSVNSDPDEEQNQGQNKNKNNNPETNKKQGNTSGSGKATGNDGSTGNGGNTGNENFGSSNGLSGNGSGDNNGNGPGDKGKENGNKELGPKGEQQNEYFKTTIIDGETVTNSVYTFAISQINKELTVRSVSVKVNSGEDLEFTGSVKLSSGENKIKVSVTYLDKDKKVFTVSKMYTVYLELLKIQINCNINNNDTVTKNNYSFTAYAEVSGKEMPVTVTFNGNVVTSESNEYQVSLQEGKNHFVVSAVNGESSEEKKYTITYNKPISDLTISTNLEDFEVVDVPEITFYARGLRGSKEVGMIVTCEGEELTSDENGNYTYSFTDKGKYTFFLQAIDGDDRTEPKGIEVHYSFVVGEDGEEIDPFKPTITTDLFEIENSGMEVPGKFSFYIFSKDYKGNYISIENIKVFLNGEEIMYEYPNVEKVSYNANLVPGLNTIEIYAYDANNQKTGFERISIVSDPNLPAEGEKIVGTIHVSMEATTVGVANIFSESVDIKEGVNLAHIIDNIFNKYHIKAEASGSLDEGYYLERIITDYELFSEPAIPEDLKEKLMEWDDGTGEVFHGKFLGNNSLGEFDFTKGSGWMYMVNGEYPNLGFAQYYPKDGDDVRIRFTLAYGSDIGGGAAMGGNNNPANVSENGTDTGSVIWDKEW